MTNGTDDRDGTSPPDDASSTSGKASTDGGGSGAPNAPAKARDLILSRRAKFMAAALAGIGVACGKEPAPPVMCLEPPYDPDAHAPTEQDAGDGRGTSAGTGATNVEIPPMVCLSVAYVEPDASVDAGGSGDASTPPDAGTPRPQPCLKIAPPKDQSAKPPPWPPKPPPQPCLSPPMPRDPVGEPPKPAK